MRDARLQQQQVDVIGKDARLVVRVALLRRLRGQPSSCRLLRNVPRRRGAGP
ncbi:MAG: hypothetical protein R3C32_08080 [Chloroflexota bacterium]